MVIGIAASHAVAVGQAVQVDPVTATLTVSEVMKRTALKISHEKNEFGFSFYWISSDQRT